MSDDEMATDGPVSDDDVFSADELAALADVDALLADPAMWGSPSAVVEDGVVSAIIAARRTELVEPPPADVEPSTAPTSTTATVVGVDAGRRSRRRSAWSLVGAAVAGAAAAALITGAIVSRKDDSTTTADRATTTVPGPLVGAGGGAPQQLTLTGTDLAPGVGGTAQLTAHPSGVEIQLALPGLPSRTDGDFYQVWVKSCDGSLLVPAGSFHDLADAVGWVGVAMADFPVLTITRESAAGGKDPAQGSSGLIVASGTLGTCPS